MNWHEYITKAWELRATAKPSLLKDMSDTHRTLAEACPMLAIVGIVETKIFKSWTHHDNNKNDNRKKQYERKKIIIRRHHYDVHSISFHYRWILFFAALYRHSSLLRLIPHHSRFYVVRASKYAQRFLVYWTCITSIRFIDYIYIQRIGTQAYCSHTYLPCDWNCWSSLRTKRRYYNNSKKSHWNHLNTLSRVCR